MKIIRFEKGNSSIVKTVEERFSLSLPPDYKAFLEENNGADVEDGFFFVKKLDQVIPMSYFFGAGSTKGYSDLYEINEEYIDDIPEESLLIGNDVGSGFILLVCSDDEDVSGVWYYDHTYFFPQSSDDSNTYFICETFNEFMEMLETTPAPTDDEV